MKKGISLFLALAATAVVAASAQANHRTAASASAGVSCKSTFTLPFVTPLTGGAAFLGQEQMSWASYAVKTLAKSYGLKIKLVGGDTPVEQGATPAQDLAQKYVGDKSVVAILGAAAAANGMDLETKRARARLFSPAARRPGAATSCSPSSTWSGEG